MGGYKKGLIVVHRDEAMNDFREIGRRIHKLDPSIAVAMLTNGVDSRQMPSGFLQLPLLVVYLVNPPPTQFTRAAKLAVKNMGKVEEYQHFLRHGIPCLPLEPFAWGMRPNPAVLGEQVVLKPANITSTGKDINMLPIDLIPRLQPSDFPEDHLIHQDSYLVQKFVKTGECPTHYRVCVFLNEVIYSTLSKANFAYPAPDAGLDTLLQNSVASNWLAKRTIELVKDAEVNELALRVAKSFPDNPLLGVDVIRDEDSGDLYVLEVNLGGNTWHFSSQLGGNMRLQLGGRNAMVRQYGAWDVAAKALIGKTYELAS